MELFVALDPTDPRCGFDRLCGAVASASECLATCLRSSCAVARRRQDPLRRPRRRGAVFLEAPRREHVRDPGGGDGVATGHAGDHFHRIIGDPGTTRKGSPPGARSAVQGVPGAPSSASSPWTARANPGTPASSTGPRGRVLVEEHGRVGARSSVSGRRGRTVRAPPGGSLVTVTPMDLVPSSPAATRSRVTLRG